jgi:hypothetical protein
MSMEIHVLSDRRLASLVEWQRAIDAAGLALTLSTDASIEELRGFLPVRAGDAATGFECFHRDGAEVTKSYGTVDFGREWRHALEFYWQGFDEGLTAYLAAAAYAKATDGVVFDPQDDVVMSPQRAFEVAEQMKADIPRAKAALEAIARELRRKHNPM